MSTLGEAVARQMKAFRDREGELVTYKGTEFRCFVEEASTEKAGQSGVSGETYGIFKASAAACIFDFSPEDFYPTTEVVQPQEGDELLRNGLIYVVTNPDYENQDTDTNGFFCYALRKIWQDAPPA